MILDMKILKTRKMVIKKMKEGSLEYSESLNPNLEHNMIL